MSRWQFDDDPNNPDALPHGNDPQSIFYRDAQGNYPNINGVGALQRYAESVSGAPAGKGGGVPVGAITKATGPVATTTGTTTATAPVAGSAFRTAAAAAQAAQLLGGMAGGRAAGKQTAADLALRQGNLSSQLYQGALAGKALDASLPTTRLNQAVRGDLAANMQDVHASGPSRVMDNVIHFSGGARPSALGPNARAAGSKLSALALDKMGNEGLPAAPQLPDLPESSATDQIVSGAGSASALLAILSQYLNSSNKTKALQTPAAVYGEDM